MKINPIGHLVKANPIQTQFKPNLRKAKMNINSIITKDYIKNDDFEVRINKPNSNPISERLKMNVNVYYTKVYNNETAFRRKKANPIKPNAAESGCFLFRMIRMRKLQSLRYSPFAYGCPGGIIC